MLKSRFYKISTAVIVLPTLFPASFKLKMFNLLKHFVDLT